MSWFGKRRRDSSSPAEVVSGTQALAFFGVFASIWASLLLWVAATALDFHWLVVTLALISSVSSALFVAQIVDSPWVVLLLKRWALVLVMSSMTLALAAIELQRGWVVYIVLKLFLLQGAAVVGLASLPRLWWRPLDGLGTLAMLLVFRLVMSNSGELFMFGRRVEVKLLASQYKEEAAQLISNPPRPVDVPVLGTRLVLRDDTRVGAVVVWVQGEGIPATSYGLAYDPDGLLSSKEGVVSDGKARLSRFDCTEISRHWLWCRVY